MPDPITPARPSSTTPMCCGAWLRPSPPERAMPCALCDLPIEAGAVGDPLTGGSLHVHCAAERLSQEAVVVLARALALVLVPFVAVWAA